MELEAWCLRKHLWCWTICSLVLVLPSLLLYIYFLLFPFCNSEWLMKYFLFSHLYSSILSIIFYWCQRGRKEQILINFYPKINLEHVIFIGKLYDYMCLLIIKKGCPILRTSPKWTSHSIKEVEIWANNFLERMK